VPDHGVAIELLKQVGPLAVTSANRTDRLEALDHVEARSTFGDDVPVYLEGRAPGGVSSTVVDATEEDFVVLREGPVTL
jgi:tRNA A37 threonylcarbamoyladenosine synthetase subunit TsaC/SUA5/YrdC